jgi:soluble lytic murein transglycosylase
MSGPAHAQSEATINDSFPAPVDAQPLQAAAPPQILKTGDQIENAYGQWKSLQQASNYPFSSYATFMIAHPGWPNESGLRKNAENMIRADLESPSLVVSFFRKFPPQTATANLRFAEALAAGGFKAEAAAAARQAWVSGPLSPEDELRFAGRFSSALQNGDQDLRMERLLAQRATTPAARQLSYTSPAKRALYDARLAFLTKAPDAPLKAAATDLAGANDAGYVADRAWWLRNTNQVAASRTYLAKPRQFTATPLEPARWLALIENGAKGASDEGQYELAFGIARRVEQTYPAGTSIRDRSYAERDAYTNITWLGGTVALDKLNRPNDAIRMFELYSRAAKSPQTKAKGLYWAGRAAERAGKREIAASYYTEAAEFYDQFYGQLALERLGRKPALPIDRTFTVSVSGAERNNFDRSEVVRATIMLGRTGNHGDQTIFVRSIAANAVTPADHILAAELAQKIGRPDLGLLVGKSAREDSVPGYLTPSYPMIRVPDDHRGNWTMIHAISRQESQFDPQAMSKVGARGLMQLMPGTARETAPRAGQAYSLSRLTEDPQYNVALGSTYFGQLLSQYGGSYILAVAAYNAGPGNVNKWIRQNGDPRLPGVDKIAWIEKIPFTETRNYVQRVLENAVVYDLLNPNRPASRAPSSITAFLNGAPVSYGSQ